MLKALKNVKPSVESAFNQVRHHKKMEDYKRNMSKFRNVGKSQPKPRIRMTMEHSEMLPDIPRVSSNNNSELKKAFLPELNQKSMNMRQRRTSQGNRSNFMNQHVFN